MKRGVLLILLSGLAFSQNTVELRLLDGMNEAQRLIESAHKKEADKRSPYHFEKARAYRDIAYNLASDLDEVGSRVFLLKSFGSSSKASAGHKELDSINLISLEKPKRAQPYRDELYGEFYYAEEEEKPRFNEDYLRSFGVDIKSLNSLVTYLREDKGLSCAPLELAKVEAYYDGMAYEVSKQTPKANTLVSFYNRAYAEGIRAKEKIKVAKEVGLECYTGKPFVPELELARVEEPKPPKIEAPKAQEEPLTVTARVHFDFDKYNIKREYLPLLNEVLRVLKENPNVRVRIEGYTDNIGTKVYNDKLALRRAQEVKSYLVKAGVPEDRIDVVGFGKERYIADNTTPIGRFTNRRAEFIVIKVPVQ